MIPHCAIYDASRLYEKAFSFRDFAREVRFLRDAFTKRRGRPLTSFLELAAGPARHAIELGAMGIDVAGLDLSASMRSLALARAAERGVALPYMIADMIAFRMDRKVDLVANMLSSATYILKDEDFVAHLDCVADALVADGMYIIELPHPSALDGRSTVKEHWSVKDEDGELDVSWRSEDWQGATSLCVATMTFRPVNCEPVVVRDEARERMFRLDDIRSFVKTSGRFEIEDVLGAVQEGVALDAEKAWRLVAVLRKTPLLEKGTQS